MRRLQQAEEKLNESIQAMRKDLPGKRVSNAISQTRKALHETQEAMLDLPDY